MPVLAPALVPCMMMPLSSWRSFGLGTLLGYPYTWIAVGAILTTAVLGLIVSLSTFLVIGATSSVTFNVVRKPGHPPVNALLDLSQQVLFHRGSLLSDIRGARSMERYVAAGRLQVGHLKTVIILAGGCMLFGEAMPPKKLAGVVLGMSGILWCVRSTKASHEP